MELVDVKRIWDQAPHNAFTDLIRFKDRWFCAFREGARHVSPDGALRVLVSPDGLKWESAALITSPDKDLRDAKLNLTPDGRLMLCGAGKLHAAGEHGLVSLAWFSDDGIRWSDARVIGEPDYWLWRVTWHAGKAYSVGYRCGAQNEQDRLVRLYVSEDGENYKTLVESLFAAGFPNESTLGFDNDTAYCLLRRDHEPDTGYLGTAQPPYTQWDWKNLGVRIGGPNFVILPDGRFLAVIRLYDQPRRTSLCWIDRQSGRLTEAMKLPSGGDTSYAGLALHDDGLLWISYYSTHEEKTAIYLARARI